MSYCVCHDQKPRVLFFTHSIAESGHVIWCLSQSEASCIVFLHRTAGSLHVIVCLSQPEASCVVYYTGLAGLGLS